MLQIWLCKLESGRVKSFNFKLILFITSLLNPSFGYSQNELQSMRLKSCHNDICSQLESTNAFQSQLDSKLLAFAKAKLTLSSATDKNKILRDIDAEEGYFDIHAQVIVLRGVKNFGNNTEVIYNLNSGELLTF